MRQEGSDRAFWTLHYGPLAGWALAVTAVPELSHDVACAVFVDVLSRHGRPARWRLYAGALPLVERVAAEGRGHQGWLWQQAAAYPPDLRRCALLEGAGLVPAELGKALGMHPAWRVRTLLRRCADLSVPVPLQASLSSRTS